MRFARWLSIAIIVSAILAAAARAQAPLEIAQAARPGELLSVLGRRAGVLGHQDGHLEAWAYPLKLIADFHLNFLTGGHTVPGDAVVRSVIVRPESTTLVYASDTFSVRETIFVPRDKAGAIIRLDVDTYDPLEIEAVFEKDLQLEWPAPLGGSSIDVTPRLNAFVLGTPEGRFNAVVGSPSGHDYQEEYSTHAVSSTQSSFKLGLVSRGRAMQQIAIAASLSNSLEAETLYRELLAHAAEWQQNDSRFYQGYIDGNLRLTLPDAVLQQAYEWAEVSMLQGVVENPYLGTGLVAGYDTSGNDARPGYAWFFGRDALWTSLALTSEQDFANARAAIHFVAKYQRADGKVPHEVSQGASFVPWFSGLPYAYASADATPLFILAVDDYVEASEDTAFAHDLWDNLSRAYDFLLSTYDEQGLPRNAGVGHGWIEGGPLFPLQTEFYQAGVSLEAMRALSRLAQLVGKPELSTKLLQTFHDQAKSFDDTFWNSASGHYVVGLDNTGKQVDVPTVLATVPMWFGLLGAERANRTITDLSSPGYTADWGMRMLSEKDARFDPNGYHWGTVWPLFTGWASVAEYRYHRPIVALQNLETNAQLTFAGAAGHVAEALSGSYYGTLETASPDQIWSSAMVVNPLVRGMLGLTANAAAHTLTFAPHVPAGWASFRADHVRVGAAQVSLAYSRTSEAITLTVSGGGIRQGEAGSTVCDLLFSPAVSLRARVRSVSLGGRPIAYHIVTNANDQHVETHIPVSANETALVIALDGDFAIDEPALLPLPGERSRGVHVLSESWGPMRDRVTYEIAGRAGQTYDFPVWNSSEISSVDGAVLGAGADNHPSLGVSFADGVERLLVTVHFHELRRRRVDRNASASQ